VTRRRLSAADRRDQLLDVAREIVAAEGFTGLTIDKVARQSEVTRTVIYQQFTDLAGLTTALLDRESAIAFAGMSTVADVGIELLGEGILAYLHAAPASWAVILRPPDGAPPEVRIRLELGRAYARQVAARHLGLDPDGAPLRILLAAIEELARLHLEDPGRYPDELVCTHLRSLVGWAAGSAVTTD
jgi:AcrR family transcriptional regulator